MSRWSGLDAVIDDGSDDPVICGSSVRVWSVINAYDAGNAPRQIVHTFDLPLPTIQMVLAFAHRYLPEKDPINWGACDAVECVPGRCGGWPVLKDTRIPVVGVLENLADGLTAEEFAEDFGTDAAKVRVLAAFFHDLQRLPLAS